MRCRPMASRTPARSSVVPGPGPEVAQPELDTVGRPGVREALQHLDDGHVHLRRERQVEQHDRAARLGLRDRLQDAVTHRGGVGEEEHLVRAHDDQARHGRLRGGSQVERLEPAAGAAQEGQARLAGTPDEDGQRGDDGDGRAPAGWADEDAHEGDHGQPEVGPPQLPELAHLADLHHAQ